MLVCKLSNPSRKGMIAVYARVPGEPMAKVATLDGETILRLKIAPGITWDDALAAKAGALGARAACLRDATRIAGARLVSRKRLLDRLKRKGHDAALAEEITEILVRNGVVNDEQLARVVASATANSKRGKRAIEQKLRTRGVDAKLAKSAAATAAASRDALADATDMARARAAKLPAKLDAHARRRRLFALLIRRGHDYDTAERAVRAALRDTAE